MKPSSKTPFAVKNPRFGTLDLQIAIYNLFTSSITESCTLIDNGYILLLPS